MHVGSSVGGDAVRNINIAHMPTKETKSKFIWGNHLDIKHGATHYLTSRTISRDITFRNNAQYMITPYTPPKEPAHFLHLGVDGVPRILHLLKHQQTAQ